MTITLTATEQTQLTQLHGLATLKRATNPEAAATSVDWSAAATGVEVCVAAFNRRGYGFGQSDIEVLFYAICFITPRTSWSPELKEMFAEFEHGYPQRWASAASTGSGSTDTVDQRKAFTQKNLDKLDKIRGRAGHDQARGNV